MEFFQSMLQLVGPMFILLPLTYKIRFLVIFISIFLLILIFSRHRPMHRLVLLHFYHTFQVSHWYTFLSNDLLSYFVSFLQLICWFKLPFWFIKMLRIYLLTKRKVPAWKESSLLSSRHTSNPNLNTVVIDFNFHE